MGLSGKISQTRKPTRARKLKDGDCFFEVVLRVGIRKEDLPAVLASAQRWEDDETDEERLVSVVLDVADQAFEANDKVEFTSASAGTTGRNEPTLPLLDAALPLAEVCVRRSLPLLPM